jgi:energy-coupling factor transporter ATP-binding protein EcfA2
MSVQIMGASGSGKTSLLRAIAGLWRSGSGTITRYICEGSGEMHGTVRHGENGSTHAIVSVLDFFSICNCQQWSHTGAESLFDMGHCNILGCFCGHICGIFWGSIFRGFCRVPRRLSPPGSIIYQFSLGCGEGCSGMCLNITNSRVCILAFSKIVCRDLRHLVQTEGIRRCLLMSTRR